MGLGLAGITVIFVALPGILLAVLSRIRHDDSAPPVIMDAGWKVLAVAATGAFVVHFIAFWLFRGAAGLLSLPGPSLVVAGILAGVSDPTVQLSALNNVQSNFHWVIVYLAISIALAYALLRMIDQLVPRQRNWLEQKLDELKQRDQDAVIWITTAMEFDGEIWLFEGVYEKHRNNRTGDPEFMFLQLAKRRRIVDDHQDDRWIEIPGESLVLRFDRWHSVNLDAFYLDSESDKEPVATS